MKTLDLLKDKKIENLETLKGGRRREVTIVRDEFGNKEMKIIKVYDNDGNLIRERYRYY